VQGIQIVAAIQCDNQAHVRGVNLAAIRVKNEDDQ
jgi:hypothetical protein